MESKNRFPMIDLLRGMGILLMFIFHFTWDLSFYGIIDVTFVYHPFWQGFARFIVSLFLICVGIGLALVHKNGIQWMRAKKRTFKIGGWALVITVVTVFFLPKNYIFFGVLHCIAVSSLIGLCFVKKPVLSLILGLFFILSNLVLRPTLIPFEQWLNVVPVDYVPFYPWFGFVLLGIYLESIRFHTIALKNNRLLNSIQILGKHSLKIYLLHQPVFLGLLNAYLYLIKIA